MRCWRLTFVLAASLPLAGCNPPQPELAAGDSLPQRLMVERDVPDGRPPLALSLQMAHALVAPSARGTLIVSHLERDERMSLRDGLPPPSLVMALIQRASLFRDQDLSEPLTLSVPAPPAGAMFWVYFDHARMFWSSLGGDGGGNLLGVGDVPAASAATVVLDRVLGDGPSASERCVGERRELVWLDTPDLVGSAGNAARRRLCVELPRSYAQAADRRYPVLYLFPGASGSHTGRLDGEHGVTSVADELSGEGIEAILVGVETRTTLGASYFADSPIHGAWAGYPLEVVAEIDRRYRTQPQRERRGLLGKSTGGFNAALIGLRHSDTFGAWAASAPDPLDLRRWLLGDDGTANPRVLQWLRFEDAIGGPGQMASYAADWSPDPSAPRGFAWPIDLDSGRAKSEVLARWLAHSPAELIDHRDVLHALRHRLQDRIFINVADGDEFDLHPPAKAFSDKLRLAGVSHTFLVSRGGHFAADPPLVPQAARWILRQLHEGAP